MLLLLVFRVMLFWIYKKNWELSLILYISTQFNITIIHFMKIIKKSSIKLFQDQHFMGDRIEQLFIFLQNQSSVFVLTLLFLTLLSICFLPVFLGHPSFNDQYPSAFEHTQILAHKIQVLELNISSSFSFPSSFCRHGNLPELSIYCLLFLSCVIPPKSDFLIHLPTKL